MDDKEKNLINSENLNSQNNVGSFPLHNNTFVNSIDKSDINNRINNTKGRNLQNNMESRETSNTSLGADSLEKKDKLDKGSLGKNALNSAGNALLSKASEDDGIVGDTAKGIRAVNKGVKATKTSVRPLRH